MLYFKHLASALIGANQRRPLQTVALQDFAGGVFIFHKMRRYKNCGVGAVSMYSLPLPDLVSAMSPVRMQELVWLNFSSPFTHVVSLLSRIITMSLAFQSDSRSHGRVVEQRKSTKLKELAMLTLSWGGECEAIMLLTWIF
jgi:hypothetical protein